MRHSAREGRVFVIGVNPCIHAGQLPASNPRPDALYPPEERDQFLLSTLGPQYPWYWSAGVLAILLGLSACILNYRVRSLDRLR